MTGEVNSGHLAHMDYGKSTMIHSNTQYGMPTAQASNGDTLRSRRMAHADSGISSVGWSVPVAAEQWPPLIVHWSRHTYAYTPDCIGDRVNAIVRTRGRRTGVQC